MILLLRGQCGIGGTPRLQVSFLRNLALAIMLYLLINRPTKCLDLLLLLSIWGCQEARSIASSINELSSVFGTLLSHRNPRDVQGPLSQLTLVTRWLQSPPKSSHANGPFSKLLGFCGWSPGSLFLTALHKKLPKTAVTSVSQWQPCTKFEFHSSTAWPYVHISLSQPKAIFCPYEIS